MGLSGPRKRTKISHDPNNTHWSRSTTSFGHRILTAQGWNPGSILGPVDAAHAQFHTPANASHIRVVLKDDNLGLGAKRGSECKATGLDAFQGLLGRLNGKSDGELEKEQRSRQDLERRLYTERRWGRVTFVRGGLLVGDRIENNKSLDDSGASDRNLSRSTTSTLEASEQVKAGIAAQSHENSSTNHDDGSASPDCTSNMSTNVSKKEKKKKRKNKGDIPQSTTEAANPVELKANRIGATNDADGYTKHRLDMSNTDVDDQKSEERKRKKQERRARKEAKRAKKAEHSAQDVGTTPVSQPMDGGTPSTMNLERVGLSTGPQVGRHGVRHRYIQQKRMAMMDSKALNEILMVKI